jgi:spore coat protein CotH
MTRLLFGLAGIAAVGAALMTASNLHSQPPGDPRPGPPPRPDENREFAFQQPPRQGLQPPGRGPREGGFHPERGPQNGPPRIEPLGAVIDTNQDGELSAEEIAAARDALLKLDRNRNGQLDRDEVPRREFRQGGPPGFGPPGGGGPGGGGRGPNREIVKLVDKFDANKNGYLESTERKAARESLADRPAQSGPGGRRPGGRGPGGPGSGEPPRPGRRISTDEVKSYPDADLYDNSVLRTFFVDFEADDWEAEMAAFYRTDVEIPANLTIDGKTYKNVGIRFRGNSSFFSLSDGQKRSLNIAVNLADDKQRIHGYKTLNLLNSHADSSFLRTVLFDRIARDFIPAPKANLVRVVINGQNWGVFINEQQVNSDFADEWFNERGGDRWKVPPDFSGGGALSYKTDNPEDYRRSYEIKSKDTEEAWKSLVDLCRTLKDIPDEKIETELDGKLNIDRALWFLALDNIFGDGDGYFSRGSDYYVYRDARHGRFHMLPHDSNETFRLGGGGEFGRGPGGGGRGRGPGGGGLAGFNQPPRGNAPPQGEADSGGQSPVLHENESRLPVVSRLLGVPALRARYLAHVRTIATEWLDWKKLGPVFDAQHAMIFEDVKDDTRKLYSFDDFADARNAESVGRGPGAKAIGFKRFADARRNYLLSHPEIDRPLPAIQSVTTVKKMEAGKPIDITIHATGGEAIADRVILYYSTGHESPFETAVIGSSEQGIYSARIPAQRGGTAVRYYVEARADAKTGTTVFYPNRAEAGPLTFKVTPDFADESTVIINEVLASNTRTLADPQGEFDDYVELHNVSDAAADLSGRYLTDSKSSLRKWAFPDGTKIPAGGFLIIWADEDGKASPGLHASFKLSQKGETVYLVDSDENGNVILNSLKFPAQRTDVAFGRGARGKLEPVVPTPGR